MYVYKFNQLALIDEDGIGLEVHSTYGVLHNLDNAVYSLYNRAQEKKESCKLCKANIWLVLVNICNSVCTYDNVYKFNQLALVDEDGLNERERPTGAYFVFLFFPDPIKKSPQKKA